MHCRLVVEKKKLKVSNMFGLLFFYLIEMLSPDACLRQYFGRSDRVYGELIAVSLMIISWQLGSNGSTSSSVLRRKRGKKQQADFFWKNKPLRINLQDIAWA